MIGLSTGLSRRLGPRLRSTGRQRQLRPLNTQARAPAGQVRSRRSGRSSSRPRPGSGPTNRGYSPAASASAGTCDGSRQLTRNLRAICARQGDNLKENSEAADSLGVRPGQTRHLGQGWIPTGRRTRQPPAQVGFPSTATLQSTPISWAARTNRLPVIRPHCTICSKGRLHVDSILSAKLAWTKTDGLTESSWVPSASG